MSRLTGKIRFRTTWNKKLALQVQFFYLVSVNGEIYSVIGWRDAGPLDTEITSRLVEVTRK